MSKLGMVIYSADAETIWNAFRLGVFARKQGDSVKVFLLAKGVECEQIEDTKFPVRKEMQTFVQEGGEILACGTCLKIRQSEGSGICPMSNLADLYQLIGESDKVVTF